MTEKFIKAMRPRDLADVVIKTYLKEGNLEGCVSAYHPDCVLYFPLDEPPKRGLDAVREVFRPLCEMRPNQFQIQLGEVIFGDIAIVRAAWRIEDDDGKIIAAGPGTVEVQKQKEDGSWAYLIDCPYGLPIELG